MEISFDMSALQSVRQALGVANLRMAMKQDAQSVATVIESLENTKAMELSVTPHIGSNFDVSI